jgi:ATP-binding cassette subfamily G (WHITE) protein 2 (SNQ2)
VDVVFLVVDDLAAVPLAHFLGGDTAVRNKTPGKLLPGQTRKQFDNEVLELLLRMLGITHTRNV